MNQNKVFLGGTCNKSTWRDELIPMIQVAWFNPVVDEWNEQYMLDENIEKSDRCNVHLYVITSDGASLYSIAEAVQSSMTAGKSTILHVIPDGLSAEQVKHLGAVCSLVRGNGQIAYVDNELARTARVINFALKV